MNVVSYIRVSGRGQLSGDGPERQRDSIFAFREANELVWHNEFFEEGVSGTVEGLDRKAFSAMVEFIEDRKPDDFAIVVERMDRLARDLMVQEFLLKECRDRGIKVFAADVGLVDQATNDGDPTRKLIRQVLGAVAEFAKSELVMKLAKARKRMKEKSGRCEGQKPLGQSKKYPGETAVVEFVRGCISHTHCEGEISSATVAEFLNQAGFKTRRNTPYDRHSAQKLIKRVKGMK